MFFRKPIVVSLIAAAAALLLYAPILQIPSIYDTLLHIRTSGDLTLGSVWLPTEAFGFYRPMTFVPIIATRMLFGYFPSWFLNGMNWLQHALNAALLVWFLYKLTDDYWQALWGGLLFAAFPFSYQAVAVYGHNVHPAIVGLILIGLHLFWAILHAQLEQRPQNKLHWGAIAVVMVIGFLTHESFLLFGFLCGLITLYALKAKSISALLANWQAFKSAALLIFISCLYFVIYQLLPIGRSPQAETLAASNSQKILYLFQGATYPFAWLKTWLPINSPNQFILISFVLFVVLTIYAARQRWYLWLLGWGWWLAASAVIAIPLPTGYLLNGPRLLYMSSVGLAILWSTLLTSKQMPLLKQRWVQAGLSLLVLFGSAYFVRGRLTDYDTITSGLQTIDAELDREGGVLLVNLPEWIAPVKNQHLIGAEFVQQLGFYLFAEEWVNHNLQTDVPVRAIKVDDLLSSTAYGYGVHEQHVWERIDAEWHKQGSDLFVTHYLEEGPQMEKFGRFQPKTTAPAIATFAPYTLHATQAVDCNGQVRVRSDWALPEQAALPHTTSVFVQLLNEHGQLIAQNDRPLVGIRPDLIDISAEFMIQDQRQLTTQDDIASTVLIGVYDFSTGQRFAATTPDGVALPDNALRFPVEPCP
ncbi:MAG: hypothetical protein ACPG8W_05660 [Candidatus Promineifilaceae bacterium]